MHAWMSGDMSKIKEMFGQEFNAQEGYLFRFLGSKDLTSTKRWLEKVKNLDIQEKNFGKAPLHYIVENACENPESGWIELLKEVLLEHSAKIVSANNTISCPSSNIKKINVNIQGNSLTTPLHTACKKDNIDVIKVLLEYGAKPDICDKRGMTPLWNALCLNRADIVTELFKHGAKIDASPEQEKLITNGVIFGYNPDIVTTLLPHISSKEKTEVLKNIIHVEGIDRIIEIVKLLLTDKTNFYKQEDLRSIRKSLRNRKIFRSSYDETKESSLVKLFTEQIESTDQEILKGLFKSAVEGNAEEFEKKLKDAEKAGFDFFKTKLSGDYKFNGVTIHKNTSLMSGIYMIKQRYKELIEIVFKQEIITQENVMGLFLSYPFNKDDIMRILSVEDHLDLVKLVINYTSDKGIKIHHTDFEPVGWLIVHNMGSILPKNPQTQKDQEITKDDFQNYISKHEEVMELLLQLLDRSEKVELKFAFDRKKRQVEAQFNTLISMQQKKSVKDDPQPTGAAQQTPEINRVSQPGEQDNQEEPINGDSQTVTGSTTPLQQTPIVNRANNNLQPKVQSSQPPITKHNPPQEHFLGISPRGWIMIAVGAIIAGVIGAALVATGVIPAIAAIGLVATAVLAGAAGAVAGGGIGYLTDTVINKCCSETTMQAA